jgi:hypothetical protein
MKQIRVQVGVEGEVDLEFAGFAGEECAEAREELRKVLLGLGVMLDPQEIRKKSPSDISEELAQSSRTQPKVKI